MREIAPALRKLQVGDEEEARTEDTHAKLPADREMWADEH